MSDLLDAGYSTVEALKSRLLPTASQEETEWDTVLRALGKAVARRMNAYCDRTLERGVDVVDLFEARATGWVLSRWPVEAVASVQVITRDDVASPITDYKIRKDSAVLQTVSMPGGSLDEMQVTFTGGYWLDPLDDSDMPEGATPLPDDILEAWVLQCQIHAEGRGLFDAIAIRAPRKGEDKIGTSGVILSDEVKETLNPHRRFGGL